MTDTIQQPQDLQNMEDINPVLFEESPVLFEQSSAFDLGEVDEPADANLGIPKPLPGSIEEAAMKIDAMLAGDGAGESDLEVAAEAGEEAQAAQSDNPAETTEAPKATELDNDFTVAIELDGETREIALADLKDAYKNADEVTKGTQALKTRGTDMETAFQTAAENIDRLIPALERQLLGEFADVKTPEDLQALAAADPLRFAEFQARQFALAQAGEQAAALQAFQSQRTYQREAAVLTELIPELTKTEGGDDLREAIRAYGNEQGFGDERFAQAGAAEIAILYKAMKYDNLEQGQAKAAERAKAQKKPAKVMTPGAKRAVDPKSGYRQAMAKLKKSGHVDDAARVIELML